MVSRETKCKFRNPCIIYYVDIYIYRSFRRSDDLQLSTEIGRTQKDNSAQVAVERRQTVRAHVRMRQFTSRLHVRRQVASGSQSQIVRMYGSIQVYIHHLNKKCPLKCVTINELKGVPIYYL